MYFNIFHNTYANIFYSKVQAIFYNIYTKSFFLILRFLFYNFAVNTGGPSQKKPDTYRKSWGWHSQFVVLIFS
jgi:hypothetical protein